jgi:hypothetical protein
MHLLFYEYFSLLIFVYLILKYHLLMKMILFVKPSILEHMVLYQINYQRMMLIFILMHVNYKSK